MDTTRGEENGDLELRPGAIPVPGYQLVARLGRGGFGEVWKVLAPGGFEVAFKFVALDGAALIEGRSLNLLKKVRHPNLLTPFGTWQVGTWLVIGMELADGSLWDRFEKFTKQGHPGIPIDLLLEWMTEASKGIDHLNGANHDPDPESDGPNIQHRDLKPQNILLVGGGVKVADFGLARMLESSCTGHTGSMTVAYAAPEYFKQQTSQSSDQYSLAVTYCILRAGRLPFTGTHAEIMSGHLLHPPDLKMLPESERPPIARALSKDPKERWPSCREMVEAIREASTATNHDTVEDTVVSQEPSIGSVDGDVITRPAGHQPSTNQSIMPRRRRRAIWVIASLVVIALLGGTIRLVVSRLGDNSNLRSEESSTGSVLENNRWHRFNPQSNTAVVFIHGIFSDSRESWTNTTARTSKSQTYWPDLVADDARFDGASVYLGGYDTALDSGEFGIRECAEQLARNLEIPDLIHRRSVMDQDQIIFVCHSTGGIIARYLLMEKAEQFKGKKIGLVLLASPSLGTDYADYFGWLADFYENRLAGQIRRNDPVLNDLDSRFKTFVYNQKTFELVGAEAWESKFILHSRWFPDDRKVVDQFSAARYFDSGYPIANSDHFSIVRPANFTSDSHVFLVRFYDRTFKRHERSASENEGYYEKLEQTLRKASGLFGSIKVEIQRDLKPGAVSPFVVNSDLSPEVRAGLDQSISELRKLLAKVNPPVVERQRVLHDVTNAVIALWEGDGKRANDFLSRESVTTYIKNLSDDIAFGASIMTYKALVAERREDWPEAIRNYQIVLALEGDDSQKETWRRLFLCKLNFVHQSNKSGNFEVASIQAMEAEALFLKNSKNRGGSDLSFDGAIGLNGVPKPWELANYSGKSQIEVVTDDRGKPALRLVTDGSSSAVFRPCIIDPKETPILSWEWKADVFPEKGDLRADQTDDQVCQVVLNFVHDRKFYLFQYGWDTNAPIGTTYRRKMTGGVLSYTMLYLVIRSGQADKGKWVRETRNLADDIKMVLKAEVEAGVPPTNDIKFLGIAVQGNTQYTRARSDGSFRSIRLSPLEDRAIGDQLKSETGP